jgi:HrpA-like RNA helicase
LYRYTAAEFPLDPMLSKTLVASDKYKCSEEVATICCMLSSVGRRTLNQVDP